jgi:YidC/Oxa1 family membrane protein insertase
MTAMMLFSPVMSIWIAFGVPAGVGFYWIWSSVFSFLVSFGLNCYFTHDRIVVMNEKEKEKARIYAEKHPEKKTFMQRMLEQQAALENQNGGTSNSGEKMSRSEQNKVNRNAINDARRRMAEKYGDIYDESYSDDEE